MNWFQAILNFFGIGKKEAPAIPAPAPSTPVTVKPAPVVGLTEAIIDEVPKYGDYSNNVKALQINGKVWGKSVGVDPGSPDGQFGPKTLALVKAANKACKEKETGVVTANVMALLKLKLVPKQADKPIPTPGGKIDLVAEMIGEAMKYKYVTENKGRNRSTEIDAWNKAMGVALGSPWCMSYQQAMIAAISKKHGVKSRVYKSAHCKTVWLSTASNLKDQVPDVGDLIIWNYEGTSNGHVGLVTRLIDKNTVETIEGNTGPGANVERNGDGVYVKQRSIKGSGKMKVLGFVKVWDDRYI